MPFTSTPAQGTTTANKAVTKAGIGTTQWTLGKDAGLQNLAAYLINPRDKKRYSQKNITATASLPNQKPTAPTLTAPANAATSIALNTALTWQAGSDPDGDSLTYTVLLGKTNPPTDTVSKNQSGLSYTPTGQANNTQYYWQVIVSDGKSDTASAIRSYTTLAGRNSPPTAPALTSPTDAATNIALNTKLAWQKSTDADGDNLTYDVYLDTNNPPTTKVVDSKNVLEFTPSGQSKGTKYYWKVVAKDGKTEVSSPVRSYTTLAPANNPPTKPTLTTPANAATDIALNTALTWQASTDADGDPLTYTVLLGTTNPPTDTVSKNQSGLTYTPTGQANGTKYYWKVVAKDGKTETSSDLRSYTTLAARPTITNVSPLTVQANSTTTFTVIGTGLKSSFAVHIDDVEISEISASSDGTKLTFKGVANKFHGDNKNGVIKLYSADVNCATDTDHPACPTGATFHVTITEAPNRPPTAPTLTTPTTAATDIAPNTPLKWEASTDADSDPLTYDVYFGKTNPPTTKVVDSKNVLEFTPSGQTNGTKYYWKVVAKDGKEQTSSDVRSYTTIAASASASEISPLISNRGNNVTITVKGNNFPSTVVLYVGSPRGSFILNPTSISSSNVKFNWNIASDESVSPINIRVFNKKEDIDIKEKFNNPIIDDFFSVTDGSASNSLFTGRTPQKYDNCTGETYGIEMRDVYNSAGKLLLTLNGINTSTGYHSRSHIPTKADTMKFQIFTSVLPYSNNGYVGYEIYYHKITISLVKYDGEYNRISVKSRSFTERNLPRTSNVSPQIEFEVDNNDIDVGTYYFAVEYEVRRDDYDGKRTPPYCGVQDSFRSGLFEIK